MDIKKQLLGEMQNATSGDPMDTGQLYRLGDRAEVEAALMELYQANRVTCCKITRRGVERIVWWPVGGIRELPRYGTGVPGFPRRNGRMAE